MLVADILLHLLWHCALAIRFWQKSATGLLVVQLLFSPLKGKGAVDTTRPAGALMDHFSLLSRFVARPLG